MAKKKARKKAASKKDSTFRIEVVRILLTADEKARVTAEAKRRDVSVSAFGRQRMLSVSK